MITLDSLPSIGLSSGILALLLCWLFRHHGERDYRPKTNGYQPVARYHQWDPILGLDLVWSQAIALRQNRYLEWLKDLHANMPKTFSINFFGGRWIYSIEPEVLKAVYATNFKDFGVEPIRRHTKGSMPFADKGVNTTDGEDWALSRQLIKPFFERDVYTSIDRITPFVDRFMELLPCDGEKFDIQPLIQRWFLDLTSEFIFGKSMDSMADPERAKIAWAMTDVLRGGRLRAQSHKFMWAFNWDWWLKAVDEVHAFVNPYIRATFKEIDEREQSAKLGLSLAPERSDLLWSMASSLRDEELLRSQLCLIIVPNNDTTSIFISNCIWYLARHPNSWERLRQEVAALGDVPLTFEILRNMKYVNGVLNETHRLIPNNVTQLRACVNDTVLPVGAGPDGQSPMQVRKGDIVSVTKTVMYRDRDYWGEDADQFRPERFDGFRGNWGFLPFGGGPRRCPAQMMVQTEAAYMLVRLARVYRRIEARDPAPYKAVMRIGPSNDTGVQIALYR
ncbi:Cytochrome P450 52A13 [Arthroderma uncinatum]|uniref:Cytochrome P450 52A13 n=1 Tax=Arthroderma uncinatum TaxID=74035 RepID=UPI00144A55CA|nr:Cytochrome P450 52A13 [Arthroderma uncinatum]KAF3491692.1 Cytochrome P450 52A13 [Arthroderma uncinatum]